MNTLKRIVFGPLFLMILPACYSETTNVVQRASQEISQREELREALPVPGDFFSAMPARFMWPGGYLDEQGF